MTPPPRPARRGLRLNQFVAAATVATVAVSAVGLAAQLRPVQAAPARAGATALIVKLADAGRDDAAQRAQLQHVLAEAGADWLQIDGFIHGTTLSTNALIARRGAVVATLTPRGFRDILEIGYERRYSQ
jgi:hypothetical protein